MSLTQQIAAPFDELCRRVGGCQRRLIKNKTDTDSHLDDLAEAADLLQSVPMSSGEFAVANGRLNNARRYLVSGEHGAAGYELRLLLRSLSGSMT